MGLQSTYRRCRCSFWSWWVCKQAKLSHFGYRKPTRLYWEVDAPKTSHCLVWSRGITDLFFFKKEQGEAITAMAIIIRKCWTNFCSQKSKRRILATFSSNRTALRATQPKLHSMFCALFLNIAYQPQSWCRLATLELRFDTVALLFVGYRRR